MTLENVTPYNRVGQTLIFKAPYEVTIFLKSRTKGGVTVFSFICISRLQQQIPTLATAHFSYKYLGNLVNALIQFGGILSRFRYRTGKCYVTLYDAVYSDRLAAEVLSRLPHPKKKQTNGRPTNVVFPFFFFRTFPTT